MRNSQEGAARRAGRRLGVAAAALVAAVVVSPQAEAAAPPNDDFDSATAIAGLPYVENVEYQDATGSADDPSTCGGGRAERTLWYAFRPAVSVRLSLSTSPGDVPIDVFTGTRGALSRVPGACLWNPGALDVRLDAVPGTTYYVMLSLSSAWQVEVTFRAETAPPRPSNDDFDQATVIEQFTFAETLDSGAATASPDDPICGSRQMHMGVWYRYTAPADARVRIETLGSGIEPDVGVYTGSRGSLSPVGECRGLRPWLPPLEFVARAGTTYHVLAGSLWPSPGTLSFQFQSRIVSVLALSAAPRTIDYGRPVRLTARLNRFVPGTSPTVSIYKQTGDYRVLVAAGAVGSNGVFSVSVRPEANTSYMASWSGDGQFAAHETGWLGIGVRHVVRGALSRHFRKAGSYRLYRRGVSPVYAYFVAPNHYRREVIIDWQVRRAGRWHNLIRGAEFSLDRESRGAVAVNARFLAVGMRYRIRARAPRDEHRVEGKAPWRHSAGKAPWRYFRVVG